MRVLLVLTHLRTNLTTRALGQVRVEHVLARLKDWQILRECRRRGHAVNYSLQLIAGFWNLKTHKQLRVNSCRTSRGPVRSAFSAVASVMK